MEQGRTAVVQRLLADKRVDTDEPSNGGFVPVAEAARLGRLEIIQHWILSGRELWPRHLSKKTNPIEQSKNKKKKRL